MHLQLQEYNTFTSKLYGKISKRINSLSKTPLVDIKQTIKDYKSCPIDMKTENRVQEEIENWKNLEKAVEVDLTIIKQKVTTHDTDIKKVAIKSKHMVKDLTNLKRKVAKIEKDNKHRDNLDKAMTESQHKQRKQDSGSGYFNRRTKTYRTKGKTAIVSNKTNKCNKMTIGKYAQNITINIHHNKNNSEEIQTCPEKQEKLKLFQSFYTESNAKGDERRQFMSTWGQNATQPGGNFIDTRDVHVNELDFDANVRVEASRWVCMICFPGRNGTGVGSGTGFRVGPRYIMTANHVVQEILYSGYQQLGQTQDPLSPLQDPSVYAVFNFTTDNPVSERQKFSFKACVPFCDDATDTAILELEDNTVGSAMPLSFTYFSLPRLNTSFTFIGHSMGRPMEFNRVERIIDTNSAETQQNISKVKQWSLDHTGKGYELPTHDTLTNRDRFLFHCKFTKGGSGSLGVIILPNRHAVVVTMLLRGFPDGYYGTDVPDNVKAAWNKENCVEQGVNLKSVYAKMSLDKPTLCREIFYEHDGNISGPNI